MGRKPEGFAFNILNNPDASREFLEEQRGQLQLAISIVQIVEAAGWNHWVPSLAYSVVPGLIVWSPPPAGARAHFV